MRHSWLKTLAALPCALLLASQARAITPGSASYTYDDLGRIIAVLYENGTGQVYSYDPAGNRRTSYSGPMPVLGITAAASVAEGGAVTLTVSRTSPSGVATAVNYQTANGSAIAGANYTAASGTLNFLATDTAKTISIATLNDGRYDGPLTFSVSITPAAADVAALSPGSSLVTINEASAAPSFSIGTPAPAAEGGALTFTVTRTGATSLTQGVSYATANGSAIAGTDYTSEAGALTFAPAVTSQTFTVPTIHRINYEGTRSFTATLSNAGNGAAIGTASATGSITDVDAAIGFSVNSPATVLAGSPVTFTVTESGGPPGIPFSVNYATASGTAVAGTDFTAVSGTLNFPVGTTTGNVTVSTMSARSDTNVRNFTLVLSGASGGAPITTATGTAGIQGLVVPPAPVISPATQSTSNGGFSLNWTNPGGNTSTYELWMTDPVAGTTQMVYSGANTAFSGTESAVQRYRYQVQACNSAGCSALSNTAVVIVTSLN